MEFCLLCAIYKKSRGQKDGILESFYGDDIHNSEVSWLRWGCATLIQQSAVYCILYTCILHNTKFSITCDMVSSSLFSGPESGTQL